jgi:hypothetical protein
MPHERHWEFAPEAHAQSAAVVGVLLGVIKPAMRTKRRRVERNLFLKTVPE